MTRDKLLQYFWTNVQVGHVDECWLWQGPLTWNGYGRLRVGGWSVRAHRLALETRLGRPIADGMLACHARHCTSRACCNPYHLYEGTNEDNYHDAVAVGTSMNATGK